MNCAKCSEPLGENDLFCGECGQRTAREAPPEPAPPEPTQPDPISPNDPAPDFSTIPKPSLPPAVDDRDEDRDLPSGPPPQEGSYDAEISRLNPGCLIFLIDQSGSMAWKIAGGDGQ